MAKSIMEKPLSEKEVEEFRKVGPYYQYRGAGKPFKMHILTILSGNHSIIVFKWYGRHRQWWHYEAQTLNFFAENVELTKISMKERGHD